MEPEQEEGEQAGKAAEKDDQCAFAISFITFHLTNTSSKDTQFYTKNQWPIFEFFTCLYIQFYEHDFDS